ncbi:MAG: glucosylceramidase, partial [Clostridia bacterium]|nr:glucosylceramidase [Clostridia bacterium]
RIATTKYAENIYTVAFKNPDGSIVLVMMSTSHRELPAVVRHNDVCTKLTLQPHSMVTVIL